MKNPADKTDVVFAEWIWLYRWYLYLRDILHIHRVGIFMDMVLKVLIWRIKLPVSS